MSIDIIKTIGELDKLELDIYIGKRSPEILENQEGGLLKVLRALPATTCLALNGPPIDQAIYDLCVELRGEHENIVALRRLTISKLLQLYAGPGHNRLTVLPSGIYVGEPEDLSNCWDFEKGEMKPNQQILYSINSFGTRAMYLAFKEFDKILRAFQQPLS
jgi:hypothetical protein